MNGLRMKKLLSLLLAVIMIAGMLPISALAEGVSFSGAEKATIKAGASIDLMEGVSATDAEVRR